MARYDLNGKVALATGGARGIGFETARQLHLRGASVAVLDLNAEEAREAAERIGPRAFGVRADVTDEGGTLAAVAAVVDRFGGLDVAVANAGIAPPTVTTARTMSGEEWKRVVDVNLIGAWHTARAALPQISKRGGQIVFIGSIYSFANGLLAAPTRSPRPGSRRSAGRCGRSWRHSARAPASSTSAGSTPTWCASRSTAATRPRLPHPRRDPAALPAAANPAGTGRGADRGGAGGAGAAGLRALGVALHLRSAWAAQPPARPPHGP